MLRGDWNMLKGKIKENWGKLTDNDITQINGKREQLLGYIQKRYGYAKEKAEQEFKDWEKRNESMIKNQESPQESKKFAGAHAGSQGSSQKGNQPSNQSGNQSKNDWQQNQGKHKH